MAKKILLADDSLTIQKVVELTFSDSEYDLVCVSNGQRALDRVAELMPDLILADVVMPEKNGYEVCEAIKANPATSRIPVVLLSGTFEPFDRERAERLGCDAIVSKPFDSQQLLRQVEALLERDMGGHVPSTATMAIPTMANPQPHPSAGASPERAPAEAGFSTEDFTGRIRVPAGIAGGPDLFEEEYGQGDVESAIAAFEKAHPEFSHVEDGTAPPPAAYEDRVEPDDDAEAEPEREKLASWLKEEPDRPAAQPSVFPPAAPAPFWVPREAEPELTPIPFGADDSGAWSPSSSSTSTSGFSANEPPPMRADEAPTQQIPLAAAFASLGRQGGMADGDRITDETKPPSAEERTAEIDLNQTRAIFASGYVPPPPPPEESAPQEEAAPQDRAAPREEAAPQEEAVPQEEEAAPPQQEAPVSREIEVLAQTTSIGQLKEMLSSVSRGEGGLSDDDLDRLASRVVERLSEKVVREIAWEVIPDVAELVIKQRIKELEAGVE